VSADLLYSDTERALAAALDDLLSARCSWSDVLAGPIDGLWSAVAADLGCAGLLIGESSGGAGASYREAATAAERLGAFVAPVPFLGSAVVATTALLRAGEQGEVLKRLAEGTTTAAVAIPFASAPDGSFPGGVRVSGPQPGDAPETVRLRGRVAGVADALTADVLVVPAEGVPRGLYLVEASDVTRTPVVSLDMTRQLCDLSFSDAPARVVASGAVAETALGAALVAGSGMLAAEALGVAQRCLDMTVAYVKERRQFARPVGSFQAIKHRLADVWVLVTQARAASRYAAACLASGDADTAVAVSLAKAYCCDAAVHAAEECVQLHGGIGFTWEHPAHLYLKRAKAASIGFGTPGAHRTSLGTLVDLQPPA
jgi:alkylation response protein AidB-like acyl-CoA dehydrogenase